MPGSMIKLDALLKQLGYLGTKVIIKDASTVMAATAKTQVDKGFRESRDPYGNPWAPLKLRPGGKPLQDTRRNLQPSITYRLTDDGFTMGSAFIGAKVHQYGATIRPVKAKALRFRGVSYQRGGSGGGARRVYSPWIYAQKVVIPARPYLPGKTMPPAWAKAFDTTAKRFFSRILTK